ncbi:MAG TPA: glycine betaine ABC transporter substrate-binding protein [Herpetosiphonaceae bacterium]|nr:glycine betaine ABC transporter substrate-binding protein [Herpetosiphonaceae bacterium]
MKRACARSGWTLLFTLAAGLLLACGGSQPARAPLRIGSKPFAEQTILAEMYALLLEDAGYPVERKLGMGNGPVLHQALLDDQLDLYPEYTGTALQQILSLPSATDPAQVYASVDTIYKERFNLIWLEPAPMNNTFALAMTQELADRHGVSSISQLAAAAGGLTMIGPTDFDTRPDGLPGLEALYGSFNLQRYISVDSTIRYKGMIDGQADLVVAYATDGEINAYNLRVLEDDKGFFPPYNLAPVVRGQVLETSPDIADILNRLAPRLTNEAMQRLNYEASRKDRPPAEVAREFLAAEGLIKGGQ